MRNYVVDPFVIAVIEIFKLRI